MCADAPLQNKNPGLLAQGFPIQTAAVSVADADARANPDAAIAVPNRLAARHVAARSVGRLVVNVGGRRGVVGPRLRSGSGAEHSTDHQTAENACGNRAAVTGLRRLGRGRGERQRGGGRAHHQNLRHFQLPPRDFTNPNTRVASKVRPNGKQIVFPDGRAGSDLRYSQRRGHILPRNWPFHRSCSCRPRLYGEPMSLAHTPSAAALNPPGLIRHDWTREEIRALFALPFPDLIFEAQRVHRLHFDPAEVQISTLLSIKTGGCPEDCAYCPQSAKYDTGVKAEKLMALDAVLREAQAAKASGASRFCMGAAWRSPKDRDVENVCAMIEGVKALGLETCATLGMLDAKQAQRLKDSGLDYYNHNLDTSPEFYGEIITTRTYKDRLDTLAHVRDAGINVCCGGIVGMGEGAEDRVGMIAALASLPVHPESVPINMLVQVEGTPLDHENKLDPLDFVRTIAVARITMPKSVVRLSAGREDMSEETQALCFIAGANSIFYGPKLLTTPNPGRDRDMKLLDKLGLRPMER